MLRSNDQISNRENASNQANDLKNDQFSLPTLTSTRIKMRHFKQFMDSSTIVNINRRKSTYMGAIKQKFFQQLGT